MGRLIIFRPVHVTRPVSSPCPSLSSSLPPLPVSVAAAAAGWCFAGGGQGKEDKRNRQADSAVRTIVMAATSVMSSSTAVAAVFLSSRVTEELTRLQLPSRHHQVRCMIVFGTIASASGAASPLKTVCSIKRRKIVVALRCSDSGEGIWGEDLWVEPRLWSFFCVNLPCNIHPGLWSLFSKVLFFINKGFFPPPASQNKHKISASFFQTF